MAAKLKRVPKKTELKPAIPRFNEGPVQGELSLDNIKVMRNDLSDADVEMVTARPARPPAKAPAAGRPAAKSATQSVLQASKLELAESQSL